MTKITHGARTVRGTLRNGVFASDTSTATAVIVSPVVADLADENPADPSLPTGFRGVAVPLGVRSEDGRQFNSPIWWRDLPLPFMLMAAGDHGTMAGIECPIVGQVVMLVADASTVTVEGTFDLGSDAGREAARMLHDGVMRHVSIDGIVDVERTIVDVEEHLDETTGMYYVTETYTDAGIGGLTMVPIPAFGTAVIVPVYADGVVRDDEGEPVDEPADEAMTAALPLPPADCFADPELPGPTAWTVEGDRLYGHVACFESCHTGSPDACLRPPRSASSYAYFRVGATRAAAADGPVSIPTGVIALGGNHAPLSAGHREAVDHYANTTVAVADVAAGEDAHGIWIAGRLRPGITDEQRVALMASAPSGDWRTIGGALELVAVLAVNTPGFPVPRSMAASARPFPQPAARLLGETRLALVAAAAPVADDTFGTLEVGEFDLSAQLAPLMAKLDRLLDRTAHLAGPALAALAADIDGVPS